MSTPNTWPKIHALISISVHDDANPRTIPSSQGPRLIYRSRKLNNVNNVKFYPYLKPDDDTIFAVCGERHVQIYRPSQDVDHAFQLIKSYIDPDPNVDFTSLAWSKDDETGNPWILVSGTKTNYIRIIDVVEETCIRNLQGHGGDINDIAVSPLKSNIIASASSDHTVRLWSLDKKFEKHACVAIFASPDSHIEPVLSICFHPKGEYLLSSGYDTMILLWAVPELPETPSDDTKQVHFPHFQSIDVHGQHVDCVRFYGDLILSHCTDPFDDPECKNILLWKIDGFSSADPIPEDPAVPDRAKATKSAYGKAFQRLLTFQIDTGLSDLCSFSLFNRAGYDSLLTMGNKNGQVFSWNLLRLEGAAKVQSQSGADEAAIADAFHPIDPHDTTDMRSTDLRLKNTAWSNCGTWLVAVGSGGIVALYKRTLA